MHGTDDDGASVSIGLTDARVAGLIVRDVAADPRCTYAPPSGGRNCSCGRWVPAFAQACVQCGKTYDVPDEVGDEFADVGVLLEDRLNRWESGRLRKGPRRKAEWTAAKAIKDPPVSTSESHDGSSLSDRIMQRLRAKPMSANELACALLGSVSWNTAIRPELRRLRMRGVAFPEGNGKWWAVEKSMEKSARRAARKQRKAARSAHGAKA